MRKVQLTEKAARLAELAVKFPEMSMAALGRSAGIAYQTVQYYMKREDFRAAMAAIQKRHSGQTRSILTRSMQKVSNAIDRDEDGDYSLRAAHVVAGVHERVPQLDDHSVAEPRLEAYRVRRLEAALLGMRAYQRWGQRAMDRLVEELCASGGRVPAQLREDPSASVQTLLPYDEEVSSPDGAADTGPI